MATKKARAESIVDSIVNGTADNAKKKRIVDAFGGEPENLIREVRQMIQQRVRHHERRVAQEAVQMPAEIDLTEAP